jgi:hypothetical protein
MFGHGYNSAVSVCATNGGFWPTVVVIGTGKIGPLRTVVRANTKHLVRMKVRYFARFNTTSAVPPLDAAVLHFSSSPISVMGRF